MWSREDIIAASRRASRDYLKSNQSADIHAAVVVDTIASMVLDNAATVAEQHGDPEIEDAINALKKNFTLRDEG